MKKDIRIVWVVEAANCITSRWEPTQNVFKTREQARKFIAKDAWASFPMEDFRAVPYFPRTWE